MMPESGEGWLLAALAHAAAGNSGEAEQALREAVRREPTLHRAWYNLGLLLAGAERLDEALGSLQRAERLAPAEPDYPFAAATIHLRQNRRADAIAAAERALAARPTHRPAADLLRQLRGGSR
jgi:tetratricopeptide (TPR) repeat protein